MTWANRAGNYVLIDLGTGDFDENGISWRCGRYFGNCGESSVHGMSEQNKITGLMSELWLLTDEFGNGETFSSWDILNREACVVWHHLRRFSERGTPRNTTQTISLVNVTYFFGIPVQQLLREVVDHRGIDETTIAPTWRVCNRYVAEGGIRWKELEVENPILVNHLLSAFLHNIQSEGYASSCAVAFHEVCENSGVPTVQILAGSMHDGFAKYQNTVGILGWTYWVRSGEVNAPLESVVYNDVKKSP